MFARKMDHADMLIASFIESSERSKLKTICRKVTAWLSVLILLLRFMSGKFLPLETYLLSSKQKIRAWVGVAIW